MFERKLIPAACFAAVLISAAAALCAAEAPSTAPATQPTTAPGPAEQPMDTLKNLFADMQSGNADASLSCFDHPTDDQSKTLKSVVHVISVVSELRKAVTAKFGADAGDQVLAICGGGIMLKKNVDQMPINVTGDKADVGQGPAELHLTKVGDVWKIIPDPDALAKAGPFFENIEDQIPQIKTMIDDVKSGKYANGDDVKSAVIDLVAPKTGNGM